MSQRIKIGFVMDQVAGHVTAYRNLRQIAEADDAIEPVWCEVHYHKPGGRLERFHERYLPSRSYHPFGVARGLIEQRGGLARGPFDVVYTNTAVAHFARRALAGTPSMFDFDSTPIQLTRMEGYASRDDAAPVARAKQSLMRRLFDTVTLNQAWSRWARQSVIDDYDIAPEKVVINPPGVDLEFWNPRDRQPRDPASPARVLFVGGDFDRKGGNDLLEWHRSTAPGAVILDIATRDDVPAAAGVNVHRGVGPNSERLRALHREADVFVLPSKGECFGIATIEAMASGLPVVASDVGGIADIVEPGVNGYIVPPGSPRLLGQAIESILTSPDRGASMGVRSREIAEQRFDLAANARLTLDRLKELAGSRPLIDQLPRPVA